MRAIVFSLSLCLFAAPSLAQTAQTPPPADSTTPPASDAAAPPPAQAPADQAPAAAPAPAPVAANPPMTGPKILISTAMGDITVQLDSQRAPKSVANVLRYVRDHHYNGTVFYRVVKGFVDQMGSFDAKGQGRGIFPGPVPLEADNGLKNVRGAVALAHGDDPNSAAADFFIDVADLPSLDKSDTSVGYAVFGQVVDGMDVVDAINQVPVGDNGPMKGEAPVDPILIEKVSIVGEPNMAPKAAAPAKRKKK
ncbi:MAG TPA: peptidylprolyl isomerase [Rhizomicrobium sp.]|nr:peptidylprolyl isomerase [Rhizomicrobium sp.]